MSDLSRPFTTPTHELCWLLPRELNRCDGSSGRRAEESREKSGLLCIVLLLCLSHLISFPTGPGSDNLGLGKVMESFSRWYIPLKLLQGVRITRPGWKPLACHRMDAFTGCRGGGAASTGGYSYDRHSSKWVKASSGVQTINSKVAPWAETRDICGSSCRIHTAHWKIN
jgi:hypothetical protein